MGVFLDTTSSTIRQLRKTVRITQLAGLLIMFFGSVGLFINGEIQSRKIDKLEAAISNLRDSVGSETRPTTIAPATNDPKTFVASYISDSVLYWQKELVFMDSLFMDGSKKYRAAWDKKDIPLQARIYSNNVKIKRQLDFAAYMTLHYLGKRGKQHNSSQ